MLPYAEGWSLFLLWVCAHIGGFIAIKVGLPPLLGMLVVGIILKNIPQGEWAKHCTTSVSRQACMYRRVNTLLLDCNLHGLMLVHAMQYKPRFGDPRLATVACSTGAALGTFAVMHGIVHACMEKQAICLYVRSSKLLSSL